ncbi:F-box protein CPR1 [Gossypium hirsutum]|uniref:F-box protein CPR1 n=1 Tax=Gossypium hirsutum TaxID=3635 RepID=A0ABM3ALH2_GOSHI|nr:F-box protein CPR1-like [Gossypium hirsutum]
MNSEYGVDIGGEAQRRTCFDELAEKKLVVMEGCSNHGSMSRLNMVKVRAMLYVKDLSRFKCISKFWCSWIEDQNFIKLHLSYSLKTNTNRSLILRHRRKCQVLPSAKIVFSPPPAFYSCSTYSGFGYDPVSDDYKLVLIVQLLGTYEEYLHSEAKVYSLRSNSWRTIKGFCFYFISERQLGVVANNVLHLLAFKIPESSKRSSVDLDVFAYKNPESSYKHLVGFDLRSEELSLVELPDFCLDGEANVDVKALGGYLCLTATHRDMFVSGDLWIMKEYGVKESWVKLISTTQLDFLPGSPFVVPLAFSKNGNKVLFHKKSCKGDMDSDSLVWYDLGSERVEKVGIEGLPRAYDVHLYVESFVPLNESVPRNYSRPIALEPREKRMAALEAREKRIFTSKSRFVNNSSRKAYFYGRR